MTLSLTGARLELGDVVRHSPSRGPVDLVHLNLAGQQANTLLHDGHAWKAFPRTLLGATRRALRAARAADAALFVQASFAFVRAVEQGVTIADPLRSCVDAILECEALVLASALPACVVRLGYQYGPESADLRAYRKAFRLGRPYWSGEASALQHHIHRHDAASALRAAARAGSTGKLYYATDGHAVSFEQFMDAFARRVGRSMPLHLPLASRLLARAIIRPEHMQQTALPMPPGTPSPRVPGWRPRFADYRSGLDQVIQVWREEAGGDRARHAAP
jgi:nucleoside-diphosphate-sugar epimerase